MVAADDGDADAEHALSERYRADARLRPVEVVQSGSPLDGGFVQVSLRR